MRIEFAQPAPDLAPYLTIHYLYRNDDPLIEGIERADIGQIRFMLQGAGGFDFPGGHFEASCAVMINGPGTGAAHYHVKGPFHCFGVALRPIGWGALIALPAHERADHVTDGCTLFGPEAMEVLERLRALERIEDMVALVEPFLRSRLRPIPAAHHRLAEHVRCWLADQPVNVEALFERVPLCPRQVTRLVNRYFGAPPKYLERKFRALRAAADLVEGKDLKEVIGRFYDQSHMIREIRHFTGHTPGTLASGMDPVLALTLQPTAFNELEPVPGG